jgi:hypothetical protein
MSFKSNLNFVIWKTAWILDTLLFLYLQYSINGTVSRDGGLGKALEW